MFFAKQLKWSRPGLVELMYSDTFVVQDVTLANSAFWTLHPVYSRDIIVQRAPLHPAFVCLTELWLRAGVHFDAPGYAPNTDGERTTTGFGC